MRSVSMRMMSGIVGLFAVGEARRRGGEEVERRSDMWLDWEIGDDGDGSRLRFWWGHFLGAAREQGPGRQEPRQEIARW